MPARHLASEGRCGRCKAKLAALAEPVEVGPAEFDEIVEQARVPVLVDFWAAWCGPCRMVAPEVHKVAQRFAGKAIVLKVDTERSPELSARFDVRGIPNFVVFSNGRRIAQKAGAMSHQALAALITGAAA